MAGRSTDGPARTPECVVFVGLPAAGKTSFFRERLARTHRHVSKDAMPHVRDRSARQLALVRAALREGASVAVDNTNPAAADRRPLVAAAREHGARAVACFFDTPIRDCLARNRRRQERERVPDVAVFAIAKKLQPPSAAEGFDALYRIRIEDGGFLVEPLSGRTA